MYILLISRFTNNTFIKNFDKSFTWRYWLNLVMQTLIPCSLLHFNFYMFCHTNSVLSKLLKLGFQHAPQGFPMFPTFALRFTLVSYAASPKEGIRASPWVLSMWSCTVKLDEEKSQYGGLAQYNCIVCGGW